MQTKMRTPQEGGENGMGEPLGKEGATQGLGRTHCASKTVKFATPCAGGHSSGAPELKRYSLLLVWCCCMLTGRIVTRQHSTRCAEAILKTQYVFRHVQIARIREVCSFVCLQSRQNSARDAFCIMIYNCNHSYSNVHIVSCCKQKQCLP